MEEVDRIVADLIGRDNGYTDLITKATKRIEELTKAIEANSAAEAKAAGFTVGSAKRRSSAATNAGAAERQAFREVAAAAKVSGAEVVRAEEQTATKVSRSRKARTETAAQADKAEVASAKAAAKARADAEIAEAERSARLRAAVERGLRDRILPQASPSSIGATVPRESTGQRSIPAAVINGAPAAATRRVDYARADLNDLREKGRVATQGDTPILREQMEYLRRMAAYRAAGLTEQEAIVRSDQVAATIEAQRVRIAAEQTALVERQIKAQSAKAASSISLFAPTLVGGITAHEISALNDAYITLTNTLKVAGVGVADLDTVQAHLLATANRSGTDINALADVYRGAALASHDLGASQADLLKITDAAANALRITGRSSGEARGALLQLSHAFESGRVTAREFNGLALNLYPILQAVAKGSDQFGGSVAKLRQALLEGDLSSKVFFQSLLKGADDLANRASKATLTTAQGFNALRNSLVVYFGEADKAQGVSAALGIALQTLAGNLDTLIPAIAAVGTALGIGYVTRLGAAALATKNMGGIIGAAFGGPVGLTITAVALAVGSFAVEANTAAANASKAHEELLALQSQLTTTATNAHAAAGGVAGVGSDALGAIPKVNAFAGAVGNLAQQLYNQARAARVARIESLNQQLTEGRKAEVALGRQTPAGREDAANEARAALGRGNVAAFLGGAVRDARGFFTNVVTGGEADRNAQAAYRDKIRGNQILARQLAEAKATPITAGDIPGGSVGTNPNSARIDKLQREINDLKKIQDSTSGKRRASIDRQIDRRQQQIAALADGATPGAATAGTYVPGAGRSGPSAQTLANRAEAARLKGVRADEAYDADLRRAQADYLSEQADLTNDLAKRAEVERQRVRFQRDQFAKEIAAKGPKSAGGTGEYTADEVKTLQGINTRTADLRVASIDMGERRRLADDARVVERGTLDSKRQELLAQQQLATTIGGRRKIAQQLLDLDYQEREADLRATLAPDSKASEGEKAAARVRLAALPAQKVTDAAVVDQQNEGAGASYLRGLNVDRGEFVEGEKVKALEGFNRELDNSVAKALHLHGIFGDIVGDLIDMAIKQALIKPLAASFFGQGEGGGAGAGGLLGKLLSLTRGTTGISAGVTPSSVGSPGFSTYADAGIPGFASGGSMTIGGNPGVDRNLLSLNGQPVARVGHGETLSISPNLIMPNNRPVTRAAPQITVLAPRHYDLSNSLIDRDTLAQMNAENRDFAVQVSQAHASVAVRQAGEQAPGAIQRKSQLG